MIALLHAPRMAAPLLCVLALLGLAWLAQSQGSLDVTYDLGLVRCALWFACGVALHSLFAPARRLGLGTDGVCTGSMLALVLAMHLGASDRIIPPLLACLVIGLAGNTGRISRDLSHPAFCGSAPSPTPSICRICS